MTKPEMWEVAAWSSNYRQHIDDAMEFIEVMDSEGHFLCYMLAIHRHNSEDTEVCMMRQKDQGRLGDGQ